MSSCYATSLEDLVTSKMVALFGDDTGAGCGGPDCGPCGPNTRCWFGVCSPLDQMPPERDRMRIIDDTRRAISAQAAAGAYDHEVRHVR